MNFLSSYAVSRYDVFHKNCFAGFLVCIFLAVSTLIVYQQVTGFDFVNLDDYDYVVNNLIVNQGITLESIRAAFTSVHSSNWHPLTWISHMIDVDIFGMNPGMHHFINVVIHILNAALLFILFTLMTGALWRSALLSALFALHPLHVESVAWISERKDVLSTFFWLLTMMAYCWYVKKQNIRRYLVVIAFYILGILSKPMVVTLPFVLILLDFWPLNRLQLYFQNPAERTVHINAWTRTGEWKNRLSITIIEKIPLLLLAMISSVITFYAQLKGQAVIPLESRDLFTRSMNAILSYVTYIEKAILPVNLSAFYPYRPVISTYLIILCSAFIILVTLFALLKAKKHPYILVGWLWYLGTLIPVIGIIQVGSQSMANRYTYLPIIGFFILIIWYMSDLISQSRFWKTALGLLCSLVLVIFMYTAHEEVAYWKNSETLYMRAIAVTKNNDLALFGMGNVLLHKGDVDGALERYRQAVEINPLFCDAYNNLAGIMYIKGNYDAAIHYYSVSLSIEPNQYATLRNLGVAFYRKGHIEKAIELLETAIRKKPDYTEAIHNLRSIRDVQRSLK